MLQRCIFRTHVQHMRIFEKVASMLRNDMLSRCIFITDIVVNTSFATVKISLSRLLLEATETLNITCQRSAQVQKT